MYAYRVVRFVFGFGNRSCDTYPELRAAFSSFNRTTSDVYTGMVRQQGRGDLQRYYRIEGGVHTDGLYALFPTVVRPILPCYRSAFLAMESWLDHTAPPPPDATVPRPTSGDPVNSCPLGGAG